MFNQPLFSDRHTQSYDLIYCFNIHYDLTYLSVVISDSIYHLLALNIEAQQYHILSNSDNQIRLSTLLLSHFPELLLFRVWDGHFPKGLLSFKAQLTRYDLYFSKRHRSLHQKLSVAFYYFLCQIFSISTHTQSMKLKPVESIAILILALLRFIVIFDLNSLRTSPNTGLVRGFL